MSDHKTHFGFSTVDEDEKQAKLPKSSTPWQKTTTL